MEARGTRHARDQAQTAAFVIGNRGERTAPQAGRRGDWTSPRLDYAAVAKFIDPRIVYDNNRMECDVAWSARGMVLGQLAEAGVAAR